MAAAPTHHQPPHSGPRQPPVPHRGGALPRPHTWQPYARQSLRKALVNSVSVMDEQPGNHTGQPSRARRWRTVLVWVGALAALALATWIATIAALDLAGGLQAPAGRRSA
jgi:hypothetical protein